MKKKTFDTAQSKGKSSHRPSITRFVLSNHLCQGHFASFQEEVSDCKSIRNDRVEPKSGKKANRDGNETRIWTLNRFG
jgi:hypothetical protein